MARVSVCFIKPAVRGGEHAGEPPLGWSRAGGAGLAMNGHFRPGLLARPGHRSREVWPGGPAFVSPARGIMVTGVMRDDRAAVAGGGLVR